ncbi:T9SS type A sorting domain-containing protein, partial [Flavobacterium sp. XN-5]|uniref:MBG domain-containing protein n=1 Tax=Flavobacterium sp. XN-5 TaxID=2599390 RepID=UPI0011CB6FED
AVDANYTISFPTAQFAITKAALTVTADAGQTKVYGATEPTLTYTITGFVNGDDEADLDTAVAIARAPGEDVGSYTITPSAAADANYTVGFVTSNFAITKANLTVTANTGQTKVYGATEPTLTYAIAGFVNGDDEADLDTAVAIARAPGENVGSYTITPSAAADANYTVGFVTSNFAITQLAVTVTAAAKSKYCGQVDPAFTFTSSPAVGTVLDNGHIVSFSGGLTRVAGEGAQTPGNIYTINIGTLANTNYLISFNYANLTINGLTIDASASGKPVPINNPATLSATISQNVSSVSVTFVVTNEANATVFTQTVLTVAGSTTATATVTTGNLSGIGVYKVTATVGSGCSSSEAYIPVYDPNGSFVTGGGWINSPAGAYIANPSLIGKANFGFNAKYKKGNNQVEGNTEFQFKAGDLNFKSTLHESGSLVISGKKATYRGDGTINGVGGFKFTLAAIDGDWNNGIAPDQFRIKIWGNNGVVYDNGLGAYDNSDASTVLGGGSIVIHEVKGKISSKIVESPKSVVQGVFNVIAYPNPSKNQFNLKVEGGSKEKFEVQVFDLLGRSVKRMEKTNGETIQFGEDLPAGSYITVINQGIETKTIRLIKK